jgi:hypothetical protein
MKRQPLSWWISLGGIASAIRQERYLSVFYDIAPDTSSVWIESTKFKVHQNISALGSRYLLSDVRLGPLTEMLVAYKNKIFGQY